MVTFYSNPGDRLLLHDGGIADGTASVALFNENLAIPPPTIRPV
jgi:hypothetical protein